MTESISSPPVAGQDFEVALESLNQWQIAWRKFRRHRLALVGAVIIGLMIFLAIFGPIIWPYDRLDLTSRSTQPGWRTRRAWASRSARTPAAGASSP